MVVTHLSVLYLGLIMACVHFDIGFSKYMYFSKRVPRDHGEHCCEQLGMTLAIINDINEQEFLGSYLRNLTLRRPANVVVWVSLLHDDTAEAGDEHFSWVDGSPLYSPSKWSPYEPDNLDTEKCVLLKRFADPMLATDLCDKVHPYICEMQDNTYKQVPEWNKTCETFSILTPSSIQSTPDQGAAIRYTLDNSQTPSAVVNTPIAMYKTILLEDCAAICVRTYECKSVKFTSDGSWNCELFGGQL